MAGRTTWGVGGVARNLIEPVDARTTEDAVSALMREGIDLYVLGGGSNVLVCDGIIEDPVISTAKLVDMDILEDGEIVRIECGAGVPTARVLSMAVELCASGIESLAGIPGSIGGAVVGNAGTRSGAVGSSVESARVITQNGLIDVSNEEMWFAYRASRLAAGKCEVLTSVVLRLVKTDKERVAGAIRDALSTRKTQPYASKTAGCTFKNPDGDSAGRLLDAAGCKGMREGGAMVSELHANFIENRAGASADDIVRLIARCKRAVKERFGIELVPEVKAIGSREPL